MGHCQACEDKKYLAPEWQKEISKWGRLNACKLKPLSRARYVFFFPKVLLTGTYFSGNITASESLIHYHLSSTKVL